jgi:hypothetical protein
LKRRSEHESLLEFPLDDGEDKKEGETEMQLVSQDFYDSIASSIALRSGGFGGGKCFGAK